jgi:hypothetical protein
MTYLVECLAQLRRHLDHPHELRPRVIEALDDLEPIEQFYAIASRTAADEDSSSE